MEMPLVFYNNMWNILFIQIFFVYLHTNPNKRKTK